MSEPVYIVGLDIGTTKIACIVENNLLHKAEQLLALKQNLEQNKFNNKQLQYVYLESEVF